MSAPFPPPFEQSQPTPPAPPVPPAPPAAPPGAFSVPVGGYQTPAGGYEVPDVGPPPSRRTGILALMIAVIAAVAAPVIAGILSLQMGMRVTLNNLITGSGEVVWAALSPVRTQALWIEILFWAGTTLGILALVLGIIAAARKRGRGAGITAIILAALGPIGFFLLASILFGVGNGISV